MPMHLALSLDMIALQDYNPDPKMPPKYFPKPAFDQAGLPAGVRLDIHQSTTTV